MSVVMQVFVSDGKMVSATDWANAIRAHGFDMELDRDFDVRAFTGFLPCKYKDRDAGFEYYYESVKDLEPVDRRVKNAIGARDMVVSFVTHSDFRDLMTSSLAAGVLCALSDGVLWDTEANEFTPAKHAVEWSRESERVIARELND